MINKGEGFGNVNYLTINMGKNDYLIGIKFIVDFG